MQSPLLARFEGHARTHRLAVTDRHGEFGYTELRRMAQTIASRLLELEKELKKENGVGEETTGESERVALLVAPGASFVASLYGVWMAGRCAVVLSPLHPPAESAYFCSDANVRTILASPELVASLGDAAEGRTVLAVSNAGAAEIAEAARGTIDARATRVLASSDALQLYTSGTTGKPKGAILTHQNLAIQQSLLGDAWGFSADDVLLHALPLHHMHGLAIALLTALGAGAHVRMLPGFEAKLVFDTMKESSVFMAVPTMYTRLCDTYEAADESTRRAWASHARALRLATSGSSSLPTLLASRWEAIAGTMPLERFGMTEIGVGLSNLLAGPRKKGSVGYPLPTVETRIVSDPGDKSESNGSGELWIRGPSVFRGYYRREDATRAAFVEAGDGAAPWFKTGDIAQKDEDGAVRILGRNSVDILKSGGYKLSALEIEEAILNLPAVREVAVVGIPDERWGDRVVACVVAHPGLEPECSGEKVRAHCKQSLAVYKCPKDVHVMSALPRNAIGKVVKPDLVKLVTKLEADPR